MPKRQKLTNHSYIQPLAPTVYEPPQELLINFPSSIVNGITKENGLVSLTLKSVACAQLVEEMSWFHSILFNTDEKPTRISDKDLDLQGRLSSLKLELETLKGSKSEPTVDTSLDGLTKDLEASLQSSEKYELFRKTLLEDYSKTHPETDLRVSNGFPFNRVEGIDFGIHVDKKTIAASAPSEAPEQDESLTKEAPAEALVEPISTPNLLEAQSTPAAALEALVPEPFTPDVDIPTSYNGFPQGDT